MKNKLIILLWVSISTSAWSQELEWSKIGKIYSFFDQMETDTEGNIYCFGSGISFNSSQRYCSLLLVDTSGSIIYDDTLYSGYDPIVMFDEKPDNEIVLLTRGMKVYSLNKQTHDIRLMDSLLQPNIDKVEQVGLSNNHYILIGSNKQGFSHKVRMRVNSSTLNVVSNIEYETPGTIVQIMDSPETESVKELYSGEGHNSIVCRDYQDSILWTSSIEGDSIRARKMIELTDGTLFVVGYVDKVRGRHTDRGGLMIKLSGNGEERWRKSYHGSNNERYIDVRDFEDIALNGQEILVCGTDGILPVGPITGIYVAQIDTSGSLRWERKEDIYGEGSTANRLMVFSEGSFYTAGTCGESDHDEPERLYISKHKRITTAAEDFFSYEQPVIFPNPVQSKLQLSGEYEKYKIFDVTGKVVQSGMITDGISIHALNEGVYFLSLDNKTTCLKFIKE